MNEKIQVILLKLVALLRKQHKWRTDKDWEITIKSDEYVLLTKYIRVQGNIGDSEWTDDIDTTIMVFLKSDDDVTYFPQAVIEAQLFISGGEIKDIGYTTDTDVGFIQDDFARDDKIAQAASQLDERIEDYVQGEYGDYVDDNAEAIIAYKRGGYKADREDWKERDR